MFFEEEGKLNNKIKEQGVLFFWGYVWLWIGYDLPQTGQMGLEPGRRSHCHKKSFRPNLLIISRSWPRGPPPPLGPLVDSATPVT